MRTNEDGCGHAKYAEMPGFLEGSAKPDLSFVPKKLFFEGAGGRGCFGRKNRAEGAKNPRNMGPNSLLWHGGVITLELVGTEPSLGYSPAKTIKNRSHLEFGPD
jgi:hypothetical protein